MTDIDFKDKDLNNFFSLISKAKMEKREKIDQIVSNSFEEYFWNPLTEDVELHKNKNKSSSNFNQDKKSKSKKEKSKQFELVEKSLGLLSEPSNLKQQNDPLSPLDQKFATLDDLQKHYKLFLERIQQQLSTLGGGGETNLTYMDVPITSVVTSSYMINPQDYYIGVNYGGAVTITLPKADREGKIFIVKDELGEASKGTNRYITILPTGSDLIDGRSSAILAYDYGSLTFIWKSNSWRVI